MRRRRRSSTRTHFGVDFLRTVDADPMRDHRIPSAGSLETTAGLLSFELDPDVEAISRRWLKNPELLFSVYEVDVRAAGANGDVGAKLGHLRQYLIAGPPQIKPAPREDADIHPEQN